MHAIRIALVAGLIEALATPALASIPGNIEERAREGLQHVCIDVEPGRPRYVACEAQGGDDQFPYTGEECTAAGLPAACTIDFIPKVKISGQMLLVNDEFTLDANGFPDPPGDTAIILELRKGTKKATLIELFDGTKIGNWNDFTENLLTTDSEIDYTNPDETVFQFANGNLVDLGLEVRELATGWFPNADLSEAVAVLTFVARDSTRPPLDQLGFDNKLASAAWFDVVIQFARTRP